ncbi:MAG TPA: hypothetical protein VGP47_05785 [Parachlamydiaceae bacterium]|nr:hypothetical protein [Parachlamydiaceae bacterium]
MTSIQPSLQSVNSLNQPANPYINDGKETSLKEMKYTEQELQFIMFAKEFFRPGSNEMKLISFGSSDEKQSGFYIWIARKCPTKEFEPNDLDLDTIISSIWEKSKNNVLVNLKDRGTPQLIENEKLLQSLAAKENENNQEKLSERKFTYRQINSLFVLSNRSKL